MKPRITPKKILNKPCIFCGYDGPRYWSAESHFPSCPFYKISGKGNRQKAFKSAVQKQSIQLEAYRTRNNIPEFPKVAS